ncbi:peptidylprolyl isomerase [Nitratireductor luteus]|uniref:peptidylprolyl isomerase n=1 Tax=Nitratireductor luteus TaxID=2976980 RepID=UPI00223FC206|nr:peptidylprolyl isomerase [Nitratireductor luteus]
MKRLFRQSLRAHAGAAALIAALLSAPAFAQEEEVVATLNGEPITAADIALAEQELDPQFAQLPEEQRRAAALSAVIDVRLFANEADEQGLDESEDFQKRMDFLRQRALHSAYIDQNVVQEISDEAVRARYDEEVAKMNPPEEVQARHILVATEEEAKAIIQQLEEGGDFAEIAKEKSSDGSASEGGDLGYFTKGRMVPEFEEAAFALEPGEFTKEPVKSQFGYHVIKVEDRRQQQPPAFEQVQNQIKSMLLREKYIEKLGAMREGAEVDIPNEELKASVDALLQQQLGKAAPAAQGQQ